MESAEMHHKYGNTAQTLIQRDVKEKGPPGIECAVQV